MTASAAEHRIPSTNADVLCAAGFEFMKVGRYEDAVRTLRQAVEIDPTHAHSRNNLASSFKQLGRETEAIAIYEKLVLDQPEFLMTYNNLAFSYLRNGRFTEGWTMYRYRLITGHKHREAPINPIDGQPFRPDTVPTLHELRGKNVLIVPEQGIGDELFFLRFTPRLLEKSGARSLWYAPTTKLYPIFNRFDYPVTYCATDFFSAPKDNCVAVPLGELPYLLGHDGTWFPGHGKLSLTTPEEDDAPLRPVGVTWRAGNPELVHRGGISKQLPPGELGEALRELPNPVVVIQRNLRRDELAAFQEGYGRPGVEVFDASARSTQEIPAIIDRLATLAGYVGVSNSNSHLYAMMGRQQHVLVIHPAEWRWPIGNLDESPWFPGFPLYRQNVMGWGDALDKLRLDLAAGL